MNMTPRLQAKVDLLRRAASQGAPPPPLLFALAAALIETGEVREAADIFRRAYQLQPWACPLLSVGKNPTRAEVDTLRDHATALLGQGVAYSSVIAGLAVAEAHSDHPDVVKHLVDYGRFFRSEIMPAPGGQDQAAFTATLAAEIKIDLEYHDRPANRAIRHAWRRSVIERSSGLAATSWFKSVRSRIDAYIAALPHDRNHPFLSSRPADYRIGAWAVVSNGDSFHKPHMHPSAWLSGVYYVVCPKVSRLHGSRRGWLKLGPPGKYGVSTDQGWGERMIAPEPGTLVLMPSYFFHGTEPMGVDEERICIAFDVLPAELVPQDIDVDRY
ncbi:MAG: putative 2OG-Fe(II) oxygenase [Sphingomonas sp.]